MKKAKSPDKKLSIAIAGHMNVGRTTLLRELCGNNERTVNYPGSSVAILKGAIKGTRHEAVDTPGTSSIFTHSEDEMISRDVMLSISAAEKADGAIFVADAKNLRRSISLFLQYAEYNVPMVFALNMVDEAESRGIAIDHRKLSELLTVDVCMTVANESHGIEELKSKLESLRIPAMVLEYPEKVREFITLVEKLFSGNGRTPPRGIALLLLVGDEHALEYVGRTYGDGMREQLKDIAEEYQKEAGTSFNTQLIEFYNKVAGEITQKVQSLSPLPKSPFIEKFGEWCIDPKTGIPIALMIVFLMYLFVGSFGATYLVDTLNSMVFRNILIPFSVKLVSPIPSAFIRDMIVDPGFGLLPTGVFLALGLVMPVLFCFYLYFGFLEDSGYLPRVSVLLDRVFRAIGLNGKGVLPLVMGFSCITMAVLTTRMLDTKKERFIATLLLIIGIPCAPLLSVMLVILEKMPISATFTIFGIIALQILVTGFLADRLMAGKRTPLLLEIPLMRFPKPMQILHRAARRTWSFMKEALPIFLLASFLVFLIDRLGGLAALEEVLKPVTSGYMGLPESSVQVFIKMILRKENGAAELERLSGTYTNLQLVTSLLVMTFFMPCINSIIVIIKERGLQAAAFMISSVMIYSIVMGGLINHVCRFLGITFQ